MTFFTNIKKVDRQTDGMRETERETERERRRERTKQRPTATKERERERGRRFMRLSSHDDSRLYRFNVTDTLELVFVLFHLTPFHFFAFAFITSPRQNELFFPSAARLSHNLICILQSADLIDFVVASSGWSSHFIRFPTSSIRFSPRKNRRTIFYRSVLYYLIKRRFLSLYIRLTDG